ncbi:MAG: tRNA preQ1(34) S-adenosylmethionine ribosyltransferase-isomerase QueA [Desulfobacterales bacterium]|nr:tRNA preQ1(34) S-adenosylmethionine ribosyltransferase-isomerase QueA [Desulfobacterales bacterium]
MYLVDNYDYHLPVSLIAQKPLEHRDQSKLLVLNRNTERIDHLTFRDIFTHLNPTDVLVRNNTKVIPCKLICHKQTGGKIEILVLNDPMFSHQSDSANTFTSPCLVKCSRRLALGTRLELNNSVYATIMDQKEGKYSVTFEWDTTYSGWLDVIEHIGHVPLPPYIRRKTSVPDIDDRNTYQTLYASQPGAIAAPTAGLHFSEGLLSSIKEKGIDIIEITLHVGYGTFIPVKTQDIRNHVMHPESYFISEQAADKINFHKSNGHRIIAVGTTTVRTLEYATQANGQLASGHGICDLFVYPGYQFKTINSMITNFHLPKSTLLMLVSAFAGKERILNAYQEAIEHDYRFFSYGDAMWIV